MHPGKLRPIKMQLKMIGFCCLTICHLIFFTACEIVPGLKNSETWITLEPKPDTVTLFAEYNVSTRYNERDMSISSAGDEIYYSIGNYTQSVRAIVQIQKKENTWLSPEICPSPEYNDIGHFLSPGGASFTLLNPSMEFTRKDYNIWVSNRKR